MRLQIVTACREIIESIISLKIMGYDNRNLQYCALYKTSDNKYCDVAMATLLVPVSFCFESNVITF